MYRRIESFLTDVLALAGEDPDAVREGVRVALANCEALFRVREPNKRMRDKAAHACRALCRARVTEELQRRRGTQIAEHLKLVRNFLDRPGELSLDRPPHPAALVVEETGAPASSAELRRRDAKAHPPFAG
jgi:hypothetical protein